MSVMDFRDELREQPGIEQVGELIDGLYLAEGTPRVLLVHQVARRDEPPSEELLEEVSAEFEEADCLLASIEGAILLLEGTRSDFRIFYLPAYLGGVDRRDQITVINEIREGTLERERLDLEYLSKAERSDVTTLIERVLLANLSIYQTPSPVAQIAANWATAGKRTSILDPACGSGDLLVAAINAIGDPSQIVGVDQNGLACAITDRRTRDQISSNFEIQIDNFITGFDTFHTEPQQSLREAVTSDEKTNQRATGGFDCVIAHPPIGRVNQTTRGSQDSILEQYSRIEQRFVHAACLLLAESGRGCFILPSHSIRDLREHVLPDDVLLKRLVKLPETAFPMIGAEPILACVEKTSTPAELGLLNLASFDEVDRICGAVHSISAAEGLEHVDGVTVQPDISTTTLRTLLEAPGAAPFFAGDLPTLEETTDQIATGMVTGRNELFYFDESEVTDSGIGDRFFTPVIRSMPPGRELTEENIDDYLFDLREFVEEHGLNERDPEEVIGALRAVDPYAAEYVAEEIAPAISEFSSLDSVLPRSIPLTNPDLVTGAITADMTWRKVSIDADEVLFNNSVVGISCKEPPSADSLLTLLNTPLYQKVTKTQLPNFDAEYVRVQVLPLRVLPILLEHIDINALDHLDRLSPYESKESVETARTILIEAVEPSLRSAIAQTYNAVSPLSTIEGYESQIDQLRVAIDQITAGEPIEANLVDEELIGRLEQTFRSAELFKTREHLIAELLTVYSEDRYWSFLGGTASQFEGVLQDYVQNTGGKVEPRETDEGRERLEYKYRDDWKPLRLKILLDDFFSGDLQELMHRVREKRNEIAHGRLIEEPEGNADIILLSFFIFTYALLNEYNEYLGAEKAAGLIGS